jgi:hypothetical protein
MAKQKNKGGGVKAALRELAPGGITKKEFEQVAEQTKASSQNIVRTMDIMNKAGQDVRLNSGAANMLIKQARKSPQMMGSTSSIFGGEPAFGPGRIGKTLQGMMGTRATGGYINPQSGQQSFTAAVPSQMMIGGTQIRPGGRVAVRPMGAAPAIGGTTTAGPYDGMPIPKFNPNGPGPLAAPAVETGGDQFDFQSMLDALTAMQQPAFDMSALQDMFQTQFDQLSSQFDQMNPLRLAQLGRAYGSDAIRARQNIRKMRQDYRRGIPAMALGNTLASLGIGGGLTI